MRDFLSGEPVSQQRFANRVEFVVGSEPFAVYRFRDPEASRPYFFPLHGPGGARLTRAFPMEKEVPGETTDHPHHRSLWAAFGEVNGADNWGDGKGHAWTRHRSLEPQTDASEMIANGDWETDEGNLLCRERLQVRLLPLADDACLIDWQLTLTAPDDRPVHFGDTKEGGLCSLRVASVLDGKRGGRIETADGGVGEKECWGKRSRWCDYSGTLPEQGLDVGMAIFCHPASFRHPTGWHVRDYGLFTANPFGLGTFSGGAEDGAHDLPAGQSLHFHYAVLIHRGDARRGRVEEIWRAWSSSPAEIPGESR